MNWVKGQESGSKKLIRQRGDNRDSPWEVKEVGMISSSLSDEFDLKDASALRANKSPKACFQGQTHGNDGFLLPAEEARKLIADHPRLGEVLHPFLITDDLLGTPKGLPRRFVIDFAERSIYEAREFTRLFARVEKIVLPDRQKAAEEEAAQNESALLDNSSSKSAKDHESALNVWWQLFRHRGQMLKRVEPLSRYIVCGRVTKRPIFAFISPEIRANDALTIFPFEDDYSFGVLQSNLHWLWFVERCSTLKSDWRYTSSTVFDSFPWPQKPSVGNVRKVADAAVRLREVRAKLQEKHGLDLRELYRRLDLPGANPVRDAQDQLDAAVRDCYGMRKAEPLEFLFKLNQRLSAVEATGGRVERPGLPGAIKDASAFISDDCVSYRSGRARAPAAS